MVVLLVNSQPHGGSNEVNWWNSGERIKASSNICSKRHEVVTGVMSNVQRLGISGVWGNGAARSREMVVRHDGLISKTDSRCLHRSAGQWKSRLGSSRSRPHLGILGRGRLILNLRLRSPRQARRIQVLFNSRKRRLPWTAVNNLPVTIELLSVS